MYTSRRTRHQAKKKGIKRYIWILIIFIFIILLGAGCGFISATIQSLPEVGNNMRPAASSQIFDVNGKLISTVHSVENRLPVDINKVPKNLQNAFLAAEDIRFYDHIGVDPRGILRAVWANIAHQGVSQGGSTITQQLAKNAFLTQDQTLKRKIQEALLALEIERKYSKQEILEMYMNQIYFGQGAYGIQMAAHTYFDKDVDKLSLAQCAMLAGLPQSPNYYSPFNNLKAGKERQNTVLDQMVKYEFLTEQEAAKAKDDDLELATRKKGARQSVDASYFVEYVAQLVAKKYGEDALYKEGLKIYTTLDLDKQKAAENAVDELPTFYTDKNGLQQPQGALLALDPHNGHILAMVGGRGNDDFNRTTMAIRQPGSAFKPFVYLAAIEDGMSPSTVVDDSPVAFGSWKPQNYERSYRGPITLRTALTHSVNTVAVKVANKVGMTNVLHYAQQLGISTLVTEGSANDNNLAVALGGLTHGVTPIDMASAYGTFANQGVRVAPTAIIKIIDRNGNVMEKDDPQEKRIISAKSAYTLTSMLESVVQSGTGGNAAIGRPIAGKTGTTDDSKDAWFIGYTPDLVAVVWMGDDTGAEDLQGITGGDTPAKVWRLFMEEAVRNMPVHDFKVPPGAEGISNEGNDNPIKDSAKDQKKDDKSTSKKDTASDKATLSNTDGKNTTGKSGSPKTTKIE